MRGVSPHIIRALVYGNVCSCHSTDDRTSEPKSTRFSDFIAGLVYICASGVFDCTGRGVTAISRVG